MPITIKMPYRKNKVSSELVWTKDNQEKIVKCFHSTWYLKNIETAPAYKSIPKHQSGILLNKITCDQIDEMFVEFKGDVVFVFPPHKEGKSISAPFLHEHILSKKYKRLIVNSEDYPKFSESSSKKERWEIIEKASKSFKFEIPKPFITESTVFAFVDDIFTSGVTMMFMMWFLEEKGIIKIKTEESSGGYDRFTNWFGVFNGRTKLEVNSPRINYVNVCNDDLCQKIIKEYIEK